MNLAMGTCCQNCQTPFWLQRQHRIYAYSAQSRLTMITVTYMHQADLSGAGSPWAALHLVNLAVHQADFTQWVCGRVLGRHLNPAPDSKKKSGKLDTVDNKLAKRGGDQ